MNCEPHPASSARPGAPAEKLDDTKRSLFPGCAILCVVRSHRWRECRWRKAATRRPSGTTESFKGSTSRFLPGVTVWVSANAATSSSEEDGSLSAQRSQMPPAPKQRQMHSFAMQRIGWRICRRKLESSARWPKRKPPRSGALRAATQSEARQSRCS